ncbi:YqxM protein [Virgibacillus subterraneus]|uniref:YqxM protein n=1 Tax=Virgibacillus subterraneus TaxID=621109 RepID=A0A1H9JBA6_9BACI|nr:amyloid fiber anchoring/assembly protein TapA [Virgibacillus subterraneus]SEQ84174.1 YqxM protein [Virgibacillus subterraneus]
MRKKRTRKHLTSYNKTATVIQVFIIWCCILIAGTYFNSHTNASFNDIEEINGELHVNWELDDVKDPPQEEYWDKSSLKFSGENAEYGFCERDVSGLFSGVINGGDGDMNGESAYDVHYHQDKAPNKNRLGDVVYSGVIQPLETGESIILKFEPDNLNDLEPGKYKFKAYQRLGHGDPNNDNPDGPLMEIWGNKEITITQEEINSCIALSTQTEQSSKSSNEGLNNNTDKEAVDEDVDLTKKSNKTDAEEAKESANKGQEANNQVSKEDTADFYDEKNAH